MHFNAAVIYSVITTVLAGVSFLVGLFHESPTAASLNRALKWLYVHFTPATVETITSDLCNPTQAVIDAAKLAGITVSPATARAFIKDAQLLYRRSI